MRAVQDLSIFQLPPGFRGRSAIVVQLWWVIQSLLFHPSPQAFYGWRRFLLRAFGAKIGSRVLIRPTVRVTYPWRLTVGDHAWVGDHVELYNLAHIVVGSNAVISQGAYLCAGAHDHTQPNFPILAKQITIEPEVWIASQVFVGPGVTIGRGAVIGARSLVLNDIPSMVMAFGQPAIVRGPRSNKLA